MLEAMTSLFQRCLCSGTPLCIGLHPAQPSNPQSRDALYALVATCRRPSTTSLDSSLPKATWWPSSGRIRGWADTPQVVVDLFRVGGGRLAEHWDVLQNEVPVTEAAGGISMFDPEEGERRHD